MSLFNIQINFDKSALPRCILDDVSSRIAELFDESIEDISGSLVDKTNIFWDGNAESAIFMTLQTVQNLNAELNQKCSSDLSKYLSQAFEVPPHSTSSQLSAIMPRFCLETNVSASKIPENFLYLCVQNLSKLTGKPEMFCIAFIETDLDMQVGGQTTDEPCGIANVSSIAGLGVEDNKRYCNVLFKLIEEYIGIPQKRLWLTFTENLPEFVTFKGRSFYHITMCRAPGAPIIHSPDE